MWNPILEGPAAAEAREAVEGIARVLGDDGSTDDVSLGRGAIGRTLFRAFLARGTGSPYPVHSLEALGHLQSVSRASDRCQLYEDLLGLAWFQAHTDFRWPDAESEDPLEEHDRELLELIVAHESRFGCELLHGFVGIGLYALERLPQPAARRILELSVDSLRRAAVESREGFAWRCPPVAGSWQHKSSGGRPYFDVGVAHGIAGILPFLAEVCAAGVARSESSRLFEGAAAWMLRQRTSGAPGFPAIVLPEIEPIPTRPAWCYGDAGIAGTLLHAARCLRDEELERKAVEIGRRLLAIPVEEFGAPDAGLCHGSAGIAHIFNRMFQTTGDEEFLAGARRWLGMTLRLRRPGEGVGGFRAADEIDGVLVWQDVEGFLRGAAGIGLVLLAATGHDEPTWDRLLLLSGPEGASSS